MNMRYSPFRLNKIHVFLFWTPVGTIFYKLCFSACSLPSFSVLPSSSPFHSLSLSLSVCLSSPSEVWIQIESSSLLYFFSHTQPLHLPLLCPFSSLIIIFFTSVCECPYVLEFQRPPVCDGTNMSWLSLVEAGTIVCVYLNVCAWASAACWREWTVKDVIVHSNSMLPGQLIPFGGMCRAGVQGCTREIAAFRE